VDCNFGVCTFDPEINNVEEKIKEVEEKRQLLEFIRGKIDAYKRK